MFEEILNKVASELENELPEDKLQEKSTIQ
jgi:hypothetical protein